MKSIIVCIIMFFIISRIGISQCSYTNSAPIVKYKKQNQLRNTPYIKLKVYNVRNDEGTSGFSSDDVQLWIADVVSEFDDIGINIDLCFQEINCTYWLDKVVGNGGIKWCADDNYLTFAIHDQSGSGSPGQVNPQYDYPDGSINYGIEKIMHELGHQFGLPHTFNNESKRDAICLVNPSECAETVNQVNCSVLPDPIKTCEITGDGFCDTPADVNNPVYTDDRCGIAYPADPPSIRNNYMSYHTKVRNHFSGDQIEHMINHITTQLTEVHGMWEEECEDELLDYVTLGRFSSAQHVFSGETVSFPYGFGVYGTSVHFRNCTVRIKGQARLENARVTINHTTFEGGVEDLCSDDNTFDMWNGFYIKGNDGWNTLPGTALSITNNSVMKEYSGPAFSGIKSASLTINNLTLGDYNIQKREINLGGNFHLNLSNSEIYGQIKIDNNFWNQGVRASVKNTKIHEKNSGSADYFGLDMLNVDINLGDFSEIKGFNHELRTTNAYCWINETSFLPLNSQGISIQSVDNFLFDLIDSHLKYRVYVENPIAFSIKQNEITSPLVVIENVDDMGHSVENNYFESSQIAVNTIGVQSGLKFLCNKFDGSSSANTFHDFKWQDDINTLQGYGEFVSSGNTFQETAIPKIAGESNDPIIYNYLSQADNEYPNPVTHNNIIETEVTGDAGCVVGASWDPFTGTVDPTHDFDDPVLCPSGIDCDSPCPLDIDCTEDCPPGINCTQDCPAGINCNEPCPLGIDCTLPCPPGINCDEPCPPGIDCTQPCPPGMDCNEACFGLDCYVTNVNPCYELSGMHGGSIPVDEVLDLVESQYLSTSTELDNIFQIVEAYDYSVFDQLIISSNPDKINLINNIILSEENPLIKVELVKKILDHSEWFSEDDVVATLSSNAIVLLDLYIRDVVFRSNSFSNDNINILVNASVGIINNYGLSTFWAVDKLKTYMSRLIHYALYRMNYRCPPSLELENLWLDRINSFASKLKIADNFMTHQQFSESENYLIALSNDADLSVEEQKDAIDYQALNNFMLQIKNCDRDLSELIESELTELRAYALGNSKFTSSKARNILAFHYDENYGSNSYLQKTTDKIYFEKNGFLSQIEENIANPIKISPNPVANVLNVSNVSNVKGMSKLVLYNELGNVRLEYNLVTESNVIDMADITQGMYFYSIVRNDGKIVQNGKIIKIK